MSSNIFISTISRFKTNQTILEIAQDCKKEFNISIFKSMQFRIIDILRKYEVLEKKYLRDNCNENTIEWKEEEKKMLLCFLLAFCHLYFKKVSEISNIEWEQISSAFNNKNVLLLRYQAKSIQKSCQRVHWDEKSQLLLQKYIRNGMIGRWADISRHIFFDSEGDYFKTPKQCREHWFNHMNKNIRHGEWNIQQDLAILESALDYGHKWARVVDLLDGKRTEHMIKNRFHSLLTCSTKIIQDQVQSKNEAKLIKILMNQLHRKRKDQKKHHLPFSHSPKQNDQYLNQYQKQQYSKDLEIKISKSPQICPKANHKIDEKILSLSAKIKINEQLCKNNGNDQNQYACMQIKDSIGHFQNQQPFNHELINKQTTMYYDIANAYFIQPFQPSIYISPLFPGIQWFYHQN